MRKFFLFILLPILAVAAALAIYFIYFNPTAGTSRTRMVIQFIRNSKAHRDWAVSAKQTCAGAPFSMPTSGFIGYLWDDSFKPGYRHQGIDIFAGTCPGLTPVYAAYDGYLTRETTWKSTVILRVPSDPLQPGTQIWTYYTHLADENGESYVSAEFPPGTSEAYVKQGTLLGYQGNFSGTAGNPVGVHLHFSIVKDDGDGKYLNELEIGNTLDPSPYFGLPLNARSNPTLPILCQ